MKSYSEEEVFDAQAIDCLQIATETVEKLSDGLRCHEVVRVVHAALRYAGHNSVVVDGHYGPVDHSWLLVRGKREDSYAWVILDPYAVGRLPIVQLVSPSLGLHELYRPLKENPLLHETERDDINHGVIEQELARLRREGER